MSEFFDQLKVFSDRLVKDDLGLKSSISPWGGASYINERPIGAVIHFTADEDYLRVLRWFLKEKFKSKVSAHAVVLDRRLGSHDTYAKDLPLIERLTATVIQCRKPETTAIHATWCNGTTYGIENVSAGELRSDGAGSFTSRRARDDIDGDGKPDKWTTPWKVPYKAPVELYGRWWSPYTPEQVAANITLLRELNGMFPGALKRSRILGHENVQSTKSGSGKDKRDPGPTYPLAGVRDAIFSEAPIDQLSWFKHYGTDPRYGEAVRDGLVIGWVKEQAREPLPQDPTPEAAWKRFEVAVRQLPNEMDSDTFATGLCLLGYGGAGRGSVEIFQRMMGLKSDAVVGEKTCEALIERLEDRGILETRALDEG
jgi:N-acetyl-anhydromuramyl-L-alanine amidase AmpD